MSVSNSTSDTQGTSSTAPVASWGSASLTPAMKLRDSCHSCAVSKVKCHREKPSCSRCLRRGIACEYVATKRGGRKHTVDNTSRNKVPPQQSTAKNTSDLTHRLETPQSLDESMPPNFGTVHTGGFNSDTSDLIGTPSNLDFTLFASLLGSNSQSLSPLSTGVIADFGPFDVELSATDTSVADIFSDGSLFESPRTNSSAASDAVGNETSVTAIPPNHTEAAAIGPDAETRCFQASLSPNEPYKSCLERALGLMQIIVPINRPQEGGALATVQDIIDKNKLALEAVSSMMQCSCSVDGYLLAVASLVVLKVLSRYNAASRNIPLKTTCLERPLMPRRPSSPRRQQSGGCIIVGNHCFQGEDQDRMKAQLVLGELHRVQSLITQLCFKLKSLATNKRQSRPNAERQMEADEMPSISALVLDQVGADLRKRLQWLSRHIIERLNKE
ncbi:hypothetical protein F5Y07DRAFT_410650 [Xylaria sp. FL0933]|nr:hypothetical protein F5Y07DRAFT_410650 [Xylaria sp. FL0933]